MSLYTSIAEYYDYIFSVNKRQVDFIKSVAEHTASNNMLDIACGTGELLLKLSNNFKHLIGVDLDEDMLKIAEDRAITNTIFIQHNMLNLDRRLVNCKFDLITCLGNSVVHLDNKQEIANCFKTIYKLLNINARFIVQIINYERIEKCNIDALASIENDRIKFVRDYENNKEDNSKIVFSTKLTIKQSGKLVTNKTNLYKLMPDSLIKILETTGFCIEGIYANYDGSKFDSLNSERLIVIASK
jgi:ubiquinone/menaquinone biosynthesis C-methylase UbiE